MDPFDGRSVAEPPAAVRAPRGYRGEAGDGALPKARSLVSVRT